MTVELCICSLWPAGIDSEAPGTVQWAGGMIDWNNPDYKAAGTSTKQYELIAVFYSHKQTRSGHFYATVQSIQVKCANVQKPSANDTSYVYSNSSAHSSPAITLSNHSTLLNSAPVDSVSGMHGMIVGLIALFVAFVHLF
jgi:hypothetical protein